MSEVPELIDEIIECLDLTEEQRKILQPKVTRNRKIIIRIIEDYGNRKFEEGQNGNIEFLQT